MNKFYFILLCLYGLLAAKSTSAQSNKGEVFMEVVSGSIDFNSEAVDNSVVLKGSFAITPENISSVSKIHINIGTTDNGEDLFSRVFIFNNVNEELEDGTSLRIEDNIIYVGMGNFTGLNHFFASAILEDSAGNLSSPIKFSR